MATQCHLQVIIYTVHLSWCRNMKKGLKGVTGHSIVLAIKAMHGGISGDFLKPSPISQIDSDLRTIHSMALEAL